MAIHINAAAPRRWMTGVVAVTLVNDTKTIDRGKPTLYVSVGTSWQGLTMPSAIYERSTA